MICQKCSKDIPEDSWFCPFCGTEIIAESSAMFCKSCGNSIPADSEFCPYCGSATAAKRNIMDNAVKKAEVPNPIPGKLKNDNSTTQTRKRKLPLIICLCVVLLALVGFGIYKLMDNTPIKNEGQFDLEKMEREVFEEQKKETNSGDQYIPCYSVDYVLEHYQELTNKEFYIDGWVSLHSYRDDDPLYKDDPKYIVAWTVLFNDKEEIPHIQDADKSYDSQISVDEEMHDQFLNVIIYAESPEAQKVVKTMKTGYHVKALGRIKTEYLAYGGVSMDATHIDIQ